MIFWYDSIQRLYCCYDYYNDIFVQKGDNWLGNEFNQGKHRKRRKSPTHLQKIIDFCEIAPLDRSPDFAKDVARFFLTVTF